MLRSGLGHRSTSVRIQGLLMQAVGCLLTHPEGFAGPQDAVDADELLGPEACGQRQHRIADRIPPAPCRKAGPGSPLCRDALNPRICQSSRISSFDLK